MKKYSVKYYHLDTSMAGSFADEADYGIIEADSEDIAAWTAVNKEFPQGEYPECTREFFRENMLVEEIPETKRFTITYTKHYEANALNGVPVYSIVTSLGEVEAETGNAAIETMLSTFTPVVSDYYRGCLTADEIKPKKKPRHIVMAEKEAADPEYAKRMDKAREILAEEMKVCTQYARHEIMDRASIVMNLLSELLEDHPGMDEELNEHLVKSMGSLYDLYQCAGNKFFEGEKE